MRLKNLIPQHYRRQLVRQFGEASLVRLSNGQHEFIGGIDVDRTAAFEWTSLFAHEIVFTHFHRNSKRLAEYAGHSSPPGCIPFASDIVTL